MKALIFALCVLLLFAGLLIADTIYIHRQTAALAEAAETLSRGEGDIAALQARWAEMQPLLSLTVSGRDTAPIGEQIAVIAALEEKSSTEEYRAALARLSELIRRLAESEAVTVHTIF